MPNMRREQEHLASADRNISDNSLFDHFQHHVPAQLIEELVSGIVVEVDPLVGSAYDLDDHTALIKERLVADRRLEQIPVHLYPALKIKRTLHRDTSQAVPRHCCKIISRLAILSVASFALHHSPTEPSRHAKRAIIIHRIREPNEGREWGTKTRSRREG